MTVTGYGLAALAAVAAGAINAAAGGGTLISFPVLTALGVPPVAANVTNTVALCPGFLGGVFAQRRDLVGQGRRLASVIPMSAIGGVVGGFLLFWSGDQTFQAVVPFLVFAAAGLLALQEPVGRWLGRRPGGVAVARGHAAKPAVGDLLIGLPVAVCAIYGGYFGAGLGVILLAVLGLCVTDSFTRLNALKQVIALSVNVTAAIYFIFSGRVVWSVALVMMVGAMLGGSIGGRFASRVNPRVLRRIVVVVGLAAGLVYLVR